MLVQVGTLRLPSGDLTSSDGEAAQHLLMTHFLGCQLTQEHHSSGWILQELAQEDWAYGLLVVLVPLRRWERMEYFLACGNMGLKLS
jgi:hypothetical protein